MTASQGNNAPYLLLWNYEFGRLLARIDLPEDDDATCAEFINGYSVLLVGTQRGRLYFL